MIEICEATTEDLPALISLYAQLEDQGTTLSNVKFSAEDIRLSSEMFARLMQYPDYKIYIAREGEQIAGTLALLIIDSVPNGIPSGIVENVVVARPWRRKGIGRQLMQFAIDICRSKRCFELTLSSRLENEAAHRFYESLGLRKKAYTFALRTLT